MSAIRFDAAENRVADEDPELTEEWGSYEDSVWYLTDGNSNGRWLFVDHAIDGDGVPLGIGRDVYTKYLSADAAESLAAALLVAAAEARAFEAARARERRSRAERRRVCEENGGHQWGPPPLTVSHATGMTGWDGTSWVSKSFWVCVRCGHSEWLEDDLMS